MKIQRYAHACFVVEQSDVRFLLDPTAMARGWEGLTDLDAVLISHAHRDHIDPETVKALHGNHDDLAIYTDESAGDDLDQLGVPHTVVSDGDTFEVNGVSVEVFGTTHAPIHESWDTGSNVGFLIADRLWFPGDSFDLPDKPVKILALPTSGPWTKLGEVMTYMEQVKPKFVFPVHDAMQSMPDLANEHIAALAAKHGIVFLDLKPGDAHEF